MSPTKKFSVWLTAIALLVAMVLTPIAAGAKPPASKVWNIYQDKLGAYTVSSAAPKGQTLIEGPFPTQADATAALTQPPVIGYTLDPAEPNGANGWYSSGNVSLTWNVSAPGYPTPSKSLVVTGDTNQTVSADGVSTFTKSATAVGGSAGPLDVTIKRDVTPPEVVFGGVSPAANTAGWNNVVPLDLGWSATDPTSGLAGPAQVTKTVNAEGVQTVSVEFTDNAGNKATDQQTVSVDLTPPVLNIGPGIADGDSFLVGSVPTKPTFDASDALSGVESSSLMGYDVTVGAHTLVATATDFAGNVTTQQIGYTVMLKPANVVEPTKLDQQFSGTPGLAIPGGLNIPTVEGIDYSVDGNLAVGGFIEKAPGIYQVTAVAQPDYELVGYTGPWTLEVLAADVTVHVATQAPTATDQTAIADGFITIPAVTGVNYLIDGVAAGPGDNTLAPGNYVVTTVPLNEFYILDGDVLWNRTVGAFVPTDATALPPIVVQPTTVGGMGSIEVLAVTGVDYFVDTNLVAGVTPFAPGNYQVTSAPQTGYALVGDTSWSVTINEYVPPVIEVTPVAPTATDQTADASGFITIPTSEGVNYALDGVLTAAGTYDRTPASYEVEASAKPGYALAPGATASWTLAINPYVPPKVIEFVGVTSSSAAQAAPLPEGWQPGDLAIWMGTRWGATTSTTYPNIPAGYTVVGNGVNHKPGTYYVTSRVAYRVLQSGDTVMPASSTSHDAILVVYRNATIGQVVGQAIASTYMAPPPPFPALPSLTSGSWVAGLASNSKGVTAVGMTVRVNPGTGAMSALDTDGGMASWASHPTVGAQHAFSFELKVSP